MSCETVTAAAIAADIVATWTDPVVVSRPGASVDAERNPTQTLTVVATVTGQFVVPPPSAGAADAMRPGAQAGQVLARRLLLPLGTPIAPGDVVDVRGARWTVRTVEDVTFYLRCQIDRVEH